jgi:hypothetical protein
MTLNPDQFPQTRQSRGSATGLRAFNTYWPIGDSSSYDEAYGPPNRVRRASQGYTGSGASTYDEGLQSRLNSRDDAREAEAKAKAAPAKKQRKKKSK